MLLLALLPLKHFLAFPLGFHSLVHIAQQEKDKWPYDIEEHPLTEVFNIFFD